MIYFPKGSQTDIPSTQTQGELIHANKQAGYVHRSIPKWIDPRGKQGKFNPMQFPGAIMAVVNSAISNCSGTTPGTGTADYYFMDGPDATAATADGDNVNVPVINWLVNTNTINAGHHIIVIQCGQFALLLTGDC